MERTVNCKKLGKELPGLETPPFPGELGDRIYREISQQAWELWQPQATLVLNHFGLSMGDPNARQMMRQQMEEFFFGEGAQLPEGWSPPAAKGGFG
jgi:Fe-S cluster biosynthesis and repair protein YggX